MAPPSEMERPTAVKRVNETLRGPVAEVLSQSMPELHGLTTEQVYDKVLDEPGLLAKAFSIFRDQRHRFRHVVRDGNSRPVLDDTVVLSCGRTLEEVIAMVVRTAAKRYFRSTKPQLSADQLYEAIKDYLMHEWQVPMVPAYADLTTEQVRSLGLRLLTIRDPQQLQAELKADGLLTNAEPLTNEPPQDAFSLYLTLDRCRLRPEAFEGLMERADFKPWLPANDNWRGLFRTMDVGANPILTLANGLKLSPEQLGIMLVWAYSEMGQDVFSRLFGFPGQPELIARLVGDGLTQGIDDATSLAECARFIPDFLRRATAPRQREA